MFPCFSEWLLALAVLVPVPAPRGNDWVGQEVLIRQSNTNYYRLDEKGDYVVQGNLCFIEYRVLKEKDQWILITEGARDYWVSKKDMVLLDEAPAHFAESIAKEPQNSQLYAFRGWANHRLKKSDDAIKDYSEAIRLNPKAGAWFNNRGLIYAGTGNLDKAMEDYNMALELNPNDAMARRNRAQVWVKKKNYAKAIEDYNETVRLMPDVAFTQNGLAWLLATIPDDKLRDGKRAVEAALKACEISRFKSGTYLDTLAAAYAENGQFDKAVEYQQKSMEAPDTPLKDLPAARERLQLYKDKKPYREP